jgi:hypothetical protein
MSARFFALLSSSDPQLVFPAQREKPEFWDAYPRAADAFAARVQEDIYYKFRLRWPSMRQPKETYQGIPRSDVGRNLVFWLADQVGFLKRHDNTVMRAIEEFIHDRQDALTTWRRGNHNAETAFQEAGRLPTPPLGFHWVYQRRKWVPGYTYRLEVESPDADPPPPSE